MIDGPLLDDAAALERADAHRSGALLALASAGARVRTGLRAADEAGLAALRPEGRPRAVLIAAHGTAALAADVLALLGGNACPVHVLRPHAPTPDAEPSRSDAYPVSLHWTLPGWVSPSDLLIAVSAHGGEAGLNTLVGRARSTGCTVVALAPADSPLSGAARQARGLPLPYLPADTLPAAPSADPDLPVDDPSDLWALLAPLLALADRIGLAAVPPQALQSAADQLDAAAVRCAPARETYRNPAKALALHLDERLPLLWADTPLAGLAAARLAAQLARYAAVPALPGTLPEVLAAHRRLLDPPQHADDAADPDDFFRDRADDVERPRPAVLMLRQHPAPAPPPAAPDADPAPPPPPADPAAADPAAAAADDGPAPLPLPAQARAQRLADAHGVPLHELAADPGAHPLAAFTELVAVTDFAAVYLGLAADSSG